MSGDRRRCPWRRRCWRKAVFEPSQDPRIFGLAPGVDFPKALAEGILRRLDGQPPEALARVEIFVNTRRMQRRVTAIFQEGPARLLPRIRLVTDLATEAALAAIPPAISPLRRRLELAQLVAGLLKSQPDLAPASAAFDLADSLAALIEEMQGEGVPPARLIEMSVPDQSGHWQRSLAFLRLIETFLRSGDDAPDAADRQRRVVEMLASHWADRPPQHPILLAGSTGSRGTTALLMQAVAMLPQGAVILPGFDFDLPDWVWNRLEDPRVAEDHPQFRFRRFCDTAGARPSDVRSWVDTAAAPSPPRNRLVSLALRPAPVTDQWMIEGARLTEIGDAALDMTLIEAPSTRTEANAIALVLRDAAERGETAALITPDRQLTRQVSAALDRWNVIPDDSAGRPLPLTAPGRFLRHVAALIGETVTVEALLTLLKHPLTHSGAERGPHLLNTRELELHLRRFGPPFPTPTDLTKWAGEDARRQVWVAWLNDVLEATEPSGPRPLSSYVEQHLSIATLLAGGPDAPGAGELWEKEAGREAWRWMSALRGEAAHGGVVTAFDYASIVKGVLQRGEVREAVGTYPNIMIWGTLEARVQGADLVVLGGLNEGTWPEAPTADPWLNRAMRLEAGLLLPERRIGLSAHDFQQAIAAPKVVLTRAIRSAEAESVPARWLNRLTNLMAGVSEDSRTALADMRQRGDHWLRLAAKIEAPDGGEDPQERPCPRPPVDARPKQLSITEVQTLIRDPYAIYAKHVLRLRPLDPLRQQPDAPLRGTVLHKVLERFVKAEPSTDFATAREQLINLAETVLAAEAPWPATRRLWMARIDRFADWFVAEELIRQSQASKSVLEQRAAQDFADVGLTLTGKIDRVDLTRDGAAVVYDYKTGKPPGKAQQQHFDKQLSLTAALVERGAVTDLPATQIAETVYIGLGSNPAEERHPWDTSATEAVLADFLRLIGAYRHLSRGYSSRRAMEKQEDKGDYDHLARFGEWDESATPHGVDLSP